MNPNMKKVLVIGGGLSGMCAAIQLRKIGIKVDLVEQDPNWSPLGAGITLAAPTLRALETIGVIAEVIAQGFCFDNIDIRNSQGDLLVQVPTPKPVGSAQSGAGILRPALASILSRAVREAGVNVRLGVSYKSIEQDHAGVDVTFTDGSEDRYEFVIGADGLHSSLRELLFPQAAKPRYTEQACWRAVVDRPIDIERTTFWMGPQGKVGVTPISDTKMYIFMNETRLTPERPAAEKWSVMMADLIRPFSSPHLQKLLPEVETSALVDFRALHNLLLPLPWHKGRIVLIGDAVHATTPHLASGAGIGIEAAIVLCEELVKSTSVEEGFKWFGIRHWERSSLVVANSAKLVEIENGRGNKEDHPKIVSASMQILAEPI
jgi:2-polyprenyl-6-methoxyphenol hydroxylase-like FAD-dependent oxidoreductase